MDLEAVIDSSGLEGVTGAILIDSVGMPISFSGVAHSEDALYLKNASDEALDEDGFGLVEYKESKVYLYLQHDMLLGIYTDLYERKKVKSEEAEQGEELEVDGNERLEQNNEVTIGHQGF